jgi:malate dehydrogenase (oxaloacetate-decarboxylating)(NADP+)
MHHGVVGKTATRARPTEGTIMTELLRRAALDYHCLPQPGKLAVIATKPLANQRDLALAYVPGVAAVCEAIVVDPREASQLTARVIWSQ